MFKSTSQPIVIVLFIIWILSLFIPPEIEQILNRIITKYFTNTNDTAETTFCNSGIMQISFSIHLVLTSIYSSIVSSILSIYWLPYKVHNSVHFCITSITYYWPSYLTTTLLCLITLVIIISHVRVMWCYHILPYKIHHNKHRLLLICLLIYYIQIRGIKDCSMLWFQYMLYDSVHWQGPITFNLVAFQLFMQYSLMIHNESFNQISPYIVYCLQFVCDKSLLLFASFLVPQLLYKPSNESNPYTIPIFFFMFIILSYSCHGFYSLHSNIEQHTWFTVWNIIFLHYSLGLSLEIENKYRWCSFLSIFIWYYHFESDTQLYYLPKIICLFQFILQKLPLIFDDFTDKDFLSTDQSKQCQMRDQLMRDINNSEAVEKAKIISKLIQANESLYCRYKQADNAKDILLKELLEYSKMNTRHKHEIKKYEKKFDSFQITSKENMKYKNKWMKSKKKLNEQQNISDSLRKQIKTLTNESSELQLAKQKLIAENECIQKQIKKVNNNSLLYKEEISKMQQTNSSLISTNYKLKKEVKMMNDKLLSFEKEKQKLFQENDECENIFKSKFQFWLNDVVKLSQYMFAFKQNKSNDIRVVPFFNKKFIKNEIKILNKMHRKLLLNESAKFKVAQIEFNTIIDSNETLKQYKSVFYNNGILTLKNLQNDITTKKILREMLIDNDDVEKINNLWNCIKHIESELCKMNQNNECVVCMDNNCHCVCIPCGHVALCGICKDLVDERCPICQIRCSIYKLYHS